MNITAPLTLRAEARAEHSFLAEMVRMMEAAEGGVRAIAGWPTVPRRSTRRWCTASLFCHS